MEKEDGPYLASLASGVRIWGAHGSPMMISFRLCRVGFRI